uniref:MCM OB domain-containing protein n=1 Tax=Glossina palpalis gambiensis TaxID=67801 RepID=A0A1B0BV02_9MUSC
MTDSKILYSSESWTAVQQGEIPKHLQLFCDRSSCERVVPGNRVLIQGIYSIRQVGKPTRQDGREKSVVGVRAPYMRVVGIAVDTEESGARCTLYSIMPTINILS